MTIAEAIAGSATAAIVKGALSKKDKDKETPPKETRRRGRSRAARQAEDRLANALRAMRSEQQADPAGQDFREELFGELRKLIPEAIRQARAGKPALLRILTRYSR